MAVLKPQWSRTDWVVLLLIGIPTLLVLSVGGGLLNRIRGGWLAVEQLGTGPLAHDASARLVYAVPTGLLTALLFRKHAARGALLGLVVAVSVFFSLLVGWGTYFSIGQNAHEFSSRVGALDWLVGHPDPTWGFWRRWCRDIAAMSLRGLMQTVPCGLVIWIAGYSWLVAASGAMMGPIYWAATQVTDPHAFYWVGPPLGELMWGMWTWFTIMLSMLAFHQSNMPTAALRDSLRSWPRSALIIVHVLLGLFEAIMIGSCISYGLVTSTDKVNWEQTLLGCIVVAAVCLICHVILLTHCGCGATASAPAEDADRDTTLRSQLLSGLPSYGTDVNPNLLPDEDDSSMAAEIAQAQALLNSTNTFHYSTNVMRDRWYPVWVEKLRAALLVPRDEFTQDELSQVMEMPYFRPLAWWSIFFMAVCLVTCVGTLVLTCIDAALNPHFFGCVPGVEC